MSIKNDIRNNMYTAMKANNKQDKQIYTNLLDVIQKAEKRELRDFTDDEIVTVLQKYQKQCKETLDFAEKAGNETVINATKREIELLNNFMPTMMSEEEITSFIKSVCEIIAPAKSNKGQFMKECAKLRGKADMKTVAQLVDKIIEEWNSL